jgi:hypothetical protein
MREVAGLSGGKGHVDTSYFEEALMQTPATRVIAVAIAAGRGAV